MIRGFRMELLLLDCHRDRCDRITKPRAWRKRQVGGTKLPPRKSVVSDYGGLVRRDESTRQLREVPCTSERLVSVAPAAAFAAFAAEESLDLGAEFVGARDAPPRLERGFEALDV